MNISICKSFPDGSLRSVSINLPDDSGADAILDTLESHLRNLSIDISGLHFIGNDAAGESLP